MNLSFPRFCLLVFCISHSFVGFSQIRVNRVDIKKWVQQNFANQGIIIGEVTHRGEPMAAGTFTAANNVLELKKGLIISTGQADNVASINNKHNQSYPFGDKETDADLQKLAVQGLYDVTSIEFDFVPLANSLKFNYQFGSEEYPEYVGSTYNDVFAFFVSDDSTKRNIALVPDTNIPVSVNTINANVSKQYFLENNVFSNASLRREAPPQPIIERRGFFSFFSRIFSSSSAKEVSDGIDADLFKKVNPRIYRFLQLDGITRKLTAQMYVVPYKKYRLKIILADVADNIYDSGVFIEDKSLSVTRDTLQPNYIEYPDLGKLVDPKQLLAGKQLEDILPDTVHFDDTNIYFDFDSDKISAKELRKLVGLATTYNRVKNKYNMRIAGHTDSIGNFQYNMALSRKRNQAVMNALQALELIDVPIEITEDAYLKPALSNVTDHGRMMNRRVEVFFVKRDF